MTWLEELDDKTIDARFLAMPQAKDLCHFQCGGTKISQWTGRETKEMMKQLLPIIIGNPKIESESNADDSVKTT